MTDVRSRAAYNRRLPCSAQGCRHKRKMVSAWCSTHARRAALFGHVEGRFIRKHETASYRRVAQGLFKRLGQHPALASAVSVVAVLITPGEEPGAPKPLKLNPRWLLWREKQRLDGVEPQDALAAVVAAWLLSYHQPRVLPDDARLTAAIAHAVFRLRPLTITSSYYDHDTGKVDNVHRPPSGLAVQLLGRRLRTELAPFLANLTALLEQEHQRSAERAMALRQPLTVA